MKFCTETGSVYEVDRDNNRIRQLVGSTSARVNRAGAGMWVDFVSMDEVRLGHISTIIWPKAVAPDEGLPGTVTSLVVAIL